MKKITLFLFALILLSPLPRAQSKRRGKNVVIKYKKYESFDLGNLEIEGEIIAPGDLSVKERGRRTFRRPLFERDDFDPEVRQDIQNLR